MANTERQDTDILAIITTTDYPIVRVLDLTIPDKPTVTRFEAAAGDCRACLEAGRGVRNHQLEAGPCVENEPF